MSVCTQIFGVNLVYHVDTVIVHIYIIYLLSKFNEPQTQGSLQAHILGSDEQCAK